MKRKQFLKAGLFATGAFSIPLIGKAKVDQFQDAEQLDKELVQKFVGASHGKFDIVKTLLDENPTLINAAHDWQQGDFETGLGAASHVGNKEIAQYLIDRGAQVNIFTAALFGQLEILKAIIDFFPAALNAKGPHGFTLYHLL